MIDVKFAKKNNYPHDKEIILFDRDAFQSLGDEGLRKVNKKYNVLCPQVFVTECLAPNKASNIEKKSLLRRLKLIQTPIVLTSDTCISPVRDLPQGVADSSILTAEEIARNCIRSAPIIMERVTPKELISHYECRISGFKAYVKKQTEKCERLKGELTPNQIISSIQRLSLENFNIILYEKQI